jgi:hypothetical protein
MIRLPLAISVLALSVLACGTYITPTPAATPAPSHTLPAPAPLATHTAAPTATEEVTVARILPAVVTVREAPSGMATGDYLTTGQEVVILRCFGEWCQIAEPEGWVYRGCIDAVAGKLGCESR